MRPKVQFLHHPRVHDASWVCSGSCQAVLLTLPCRGRACLAQTWYPDQPPIYPLFPNSPWVRGTTAACRKYEREATRRCVGRGVPLQFLILDLSPVTSIDASAGHFLRDLAREVAGWRLRLGLANFRATCVRVLRRSGVLASIGACAIHNVLAP